MLVKKHLFFDLDHTLWDFRQNSEEVLGILYQEYESLQVVAFEEFRSVYKFQNRKFWSRYRKGFITSEELKWKRFWHCLLVLGNSDVALAKELSERYLHYLPHQTKLCAGALDLLDQLRDQGYVMHIITNGFTEVQKAKIKSSGIEPYFQTITTSENARGSKPGKKIFDSALQKAHARPEDSIVIGDSLESDIKGAIENGIDAIFYNPYQVENPYAERCQTIHQLQELKDLLKPI